MLHTTQIAVIKKKLKSRYEELRKLIGEELILHDNEQYSELAGAVHDRQDESVANLLVDLNIASIDRHIKELREIETSLEMIKEGRYGTCLSCRTAIAYERLKSYPAAVRCIQCQTMYEKTHAQPGHASL